MRRRPQVVVAAAFAGLCLIGLTSCTRNRGDKRVVLDLLDRAATQPRRFTYVDDDRRKQLSVVGLIGDPFRYEAELSVNGQHGWDETVSDDTVADRFIDPTLLPVVLAKALGQATAAVLAQGADALAQAPAPVSIANHIAPVDALRTGRWLVDPAGAPNVVTGSYAPHGGDDPIHDAVTALAYVRDAVNASPFVKKYDPQSLSPIYPPTEDPFPKPTGGLVRYDLAQVPLPSVGSTNPAAQVGITNFRKMAVYVRAGRVVEVREVIDILDRIPELTRNKNFTLRAGLSGDAQVQAVLAEINQFSTRNGGEPIRARAMTLQLLDLGTPRRVTLPVTDVVVGNAGILPGRGFATPGAAAPTAGLGLTGASSPTTTTVGAGG